MDNLLFKLTEKHFPNVSRETIEKLNVYLELILKWNQKINLISRRATKEEVVSRHLLDALQLINLLPSKEALITDLGSGAGIPGLVLAIAGYKCKLVEINQKKSAFIQEVISKLRLEAEVLNMDFTKLNGYKTDYVVSRAVTNVEELVDAAKNIITPESNFILLKGANQISEVEDIKKQWSFKLQVHQNTFNTNGIIIQISNLKEWAR
jgi:16S rRNA (guanine(527)-N(7))-methyltransferase RsmG